MPDPVDSATDATLRWWRQTDRYGALLLLLVLDYLTALLVGGSATGQPALLLLTVCCLLFALHTSDVRGRVFWFAVGVCVVAVLIAAVETSRSHADASAVVSVVVGLLLLASPISILRRLLGHHTIISSETLAAALCTYLLIGLAFANLYAALAAVDEAAFDGISSSDRLSDLVYFSFITLTTVGFGDITPANEVARSMAVTEALMGQIILVTFVGRIVSQMSAAPRRGTVLADLEEGRELMEADDAAAPTRAEPDDETGTT